MRKIAKSDDIQPGQARMSEFGGKRIALFKVDGLFYAIDDTCTHRGGPLSEGELNGKEATCPWHEAVFDVTTGQVLRPLVPGGISSYRTRGEGKDVEVEIWTLPNVRAREGLNAPRGSRRRHGG